MIADLAWCEPAEYVATEPAGNRATETPRLIANDPSSQVDYFTSDTPEVLTDDNGGFLYGDWSSTPTAANADSRWREPAAWRN